eukprot:6214157-Prymnesium_polylepis.1
MHVGSLACPCRKRRRGETAARRCPQPRYSPVGSGSIFRCNIPQVILIHTQTRDYTRLQFTPRRRVLRPVELRPARRRSSLSVSRLLDPRVSVGPSALR